MTLSEFLSAEQTESEVMLFRYLDAKLMRPQNQLDQANLV